jgi:hypothetical protein
LTRYTQPEPELRLLTNQLKHIFIAFLAYCLQVTLQRRLQALAPGLTAVPSRSLPPSR